jgi:hypothetical protein
VNAPKVDFPSFVSSLAAGAAAALNQAEQLRGGAAPRSESGEEQELSPQQRDEQVQGALVVARQLIDTLVMLEEKTSGNLSVGEQEVLRTSLTGLRISYVRAASPRS